MLAVAAIVHAGWLLVVWLEGAWGTDEILTVSGHLQLAGIVAAIISVRFWISFERLKTVAPIFILTGASILLLSSVEISVFRTEFRGAPLIAQFNLTFLSNDQTAYFAIALVIAIYVAIGRAVVEGRKAELIGPMPLTNPDMQEQGASASESAGAEKPAPDSVSAAKQEPTMSPEDLVTKILTDLMLETKKRAQFVLALILSLLAAGVVVIAFAGQITTLDLIAGSEATELVQERSDLRSKIEKSETEINDTRKAQRDEYPTLIELGFKVRRDDDVTKFDGAELHMARIRYNQTLGSSPDAEANIAAMVRQRKRILQMPAFGNFVNSATTPTRKPIEQIDPSLGASQLELSLMYQFATKAYNEALDRNQTIIDAKGVIETSTKRLEQIQIITDEAEKNRLRSSSTSARQDYSFLVASGITRFGIVAIIVYIIQILVSLYRYNIRLSHFYAGRLKAFVIGDRDGKTIDYFSEFFDSQGVNFGKDVVSPTTEISDMIKKGFEEAGKIFAKGAGQGGTG